jgi:small-conductance mechanosensitive channel
VALTAFLLLVFGVEAGLAQEAPPVAEPTVQAPPGEAVGDRPLRADSLAQEATAQARETFFGLWEGFVGSLPQLAVALLVLLLAWGVVRLVRPLLHQATKRIRQGVALGVLLQMAIWLFAVGIAVSVIAGDIRALLGSLGLIGLALSWSLQTPIESFTGWLLNSFQGYYRVGDRIAVGEVFGDVVAIDVLTTTVWEYGGADRAPSGITAEQPTGRLITFPNNEVLTGSIVNYTRDFPYVWDELAVSLAAESDLPYALEVTERLASELLAERMREPAEAYRSQLAASGVPAEVSDRPEVFVTMTASGIDLVVRYLVGARERRKWKSDLTALVVTEYNRESHAGRILPLYPRQQVQLVGPDGAPAGWPGSGGA